MTLMRKLDIGAGVFLPLIFSFAAGALVKLDARGAWRDFARVREITVSGRVHASGEAIRLALAVPEDRPLADWDMNAAYRRLGENPWIKTAEIRRIMPHGVRVKIIERKPLAIWQADRQHQLIDDEGGVIAASIRGFEYLPVVVGKDAPENARALIEALDGVPLLKPRVKAASRIGERRWRLMFDSVTDGTAVDLSEDDFINDLTRLEKIERDYGIVNRRIESVDLRLPDRVSLTVKGMR